MGERVVDRFRRQHASSRGQLLRAASNYLSPLLTYYKSVGDRQAAIFGANMKCVAASVELSMPSPCEEQTSCGKSACTRKMRVQYQAQRLSARLVNPLGEMIIHEKKKNRHDELKTATHTHTCTRSDSSMGAHDGRESPANSRLHNKEWTEVRGLYHLGVRNVLPFHGVGCFVGYIVCGF